MDSPPPEPLRPVSPSPACLRTAPVPGRFKLAADVAVMGSPSPKRRGGRGRPASFPTFGPGPVTRPPVLPRVTGGGSRPGGLERSRSRGFGQSERAPPGLAQAERGRPPKARAGGGGDGGGGERSPGPCPTWLVALRPRRPPVPLAQTSNPTTNPALRMQQLRFRSAFSPLSIPTL